VKIIGVGACDLSQVLAFKDAEQEQKVNAGGL